MPKTKTINLRVDVERLALIDAAALKAGQSRTEYMVIRSLAAIDPKAAAVQELTARLPVTTASQLPTSEDGDHPGQATGRCWKCGATLIPWGPGQKRCRTCAQNYAAG